LSDFQSVEDSLQPDSIGFGQFQGAIQQGRLQEAFHEVPLEHLESGLRRFSGSLGLGLSDRSGSGFLAEHGKRLGHSQGDIPFF
jgi:hypothetical protein